MKCIGSNKNQLVIPSDHTTDKLEDHIYIYIYICMYIYIYMHVSIKQFEQNESYYIQVKFKYECFKGGKAEVAGGSNS